MAGSRRARAQSRGRVLRWPHFVAFCVYFRFLFSFFFVQGVSEKQRRVRVRQAYRYRFLPRFTPSRAVGVAAPPRSLCGEDGFNRCETEFLGELDLKMGFGIVVMVHEFF